MHFEGFDEKVYIPKNFRSGENGVDPNTVGILKNYLLPPLIPDGCFTNNYVTR